MWVGVLLMGAGCSGINTSQSVSPATFLLPGIMQANPLPAGPGLILPAKESLPDAAQS
jgi:hypothetical protein